jgi:DNA repair ATPase RecN
MGAKRKIWARSEDSHELQVHGGAIRFGSAVELNTYVEDDSASTPMQSGPMSMQTNSVEASSDNTVATPASLQDVVLASAAAIRDIDDIMAELQAARDQLEADAERVWRANTQYVQLAKTASASAKSITEIIGQWLEHERFGSSPPPQISADQEKHPEG